jgi:hypothetical protein
MVPFSWFTKRAICQRRGAADVGTDRREP